MKQKQQIYEKRVAFWGTIGAKTFIHYIKNAPKTQSKLDNKHKNNIQADPYTLGQITSFIHKIQNSVLMCLKFLPKVVVYLFVALFVLNELVFCLFVCFDVILNLLGFFLFCLFLFLLFCFFRFAVVFNIFF